MSVTCPAPEAPAAVATPAGWIVTRSRQDGRCKAVAIPSKSRAGLYHLVTRHGCDCAGFAYRGRCSHYVALRRYLVDAERAKIAVQPVRVPLLRYA